MRKVTGNCMSTKELIRLTCLTQKYIAGTLNQMSKYWIVHTIRQKKTADMQIHNSIRMQMTLEHPNVAKISTKDKDQEDGIN